MIMFPMGTGYNVPSPSTSRDFPSALAVVASDNFKSGLSAQLARGGDVMVDADSIFSGRGDAWSNGLVQRLRDMILTRFENPGWECGYGFFPVGDPWTAASGTPTYFHTGTFVAGTASPNYTEGITVKTNGAGSQCRFSFPPTIVGAGGKVYKIKKVELVLSTFSGGVAAPSFAVDVYAAGGNAVLAPGDAFIASGTGGTITNNGLTGASQTITPGNITNATNYRTGLLNITFNGSTQYPVIQVTSSDAGSQVCGIILYCDDWDVDGKGIRFHDFSISGSQLLPTRSTQTSGAPNLFANQGIGFNGRYRTYQSRYGNYATSNTFNTLGPSCNLKWLILAKGINDQLINGSTPSQFAAYLMDTVDALMNANPQTYVTLVQDYCPGGIVAGWRTGYDTTLAAPMLSAIVSWTAYNAVFYAVQAKYPDRVEVVSVDKLLGELSYTSAITSRGWSNGDQIHWLGGGPAWACGALMSQKGVKQSFPISSGLNGTTPWNTALHAIRFDRFETLNDYGSAGGTWTQNTGANSGQRPTRSSDNLSVQWNQGSNLPGYGFVYSANAAPPQGDFTVFVRLYVHTTPPAGQVNVCSIYGDEGGTAANWQFRLGDGSGPNALKPMIPTSTACANTAIALDTWSTIAAVKSGATITYYVNGVAAGTSTDTTAANAAGNRRIGEIAGSSGRPFTDGSKLSHIVEYPSALTAAQIAALHANPDLPFALTS